MVKPTTKGTPIRTPAPLPHLNMHAISNPAALLAQHNAVHLHPRKKHCKIESTKQGSHSSSLPRCTCEFEGCPRLSLVLLKFLPDVLSHIILVQPNTVFDTCYIDHRPQVFVPGRVLVVSLPPTSTCNASQLSHPVVPCSNHAALCHCACLVH